MLRWRGHEKELSGGEPMTTNNRMEMTAAIEGLAALKRPSEVRLHTNSMYLRDGITRWIATWKRNGWRTADKKPVKNADLWLRLETGARAAPRRVALGARPCRPPGERASGRAGPRLRPRRPGRAGGRLAGLPATAPAQPARTASFRCRSGPVFSHKFLI